MDNIQGAILDIKLRHLAGWTEKRRAVAAHYDEALSGIRVLAPQKPIGQEHVYHVYAIRSPHRDRIQSVLKESGIMTGMHYPRPVHVQPAYSSLGHNEGDFPASEQFAAETLSLPIYPELTVQQVRHVCDTLHRICEESTSASGVGGEFHASQQAVGS
jgi:dTDP-4-amino-4,6-dideoxygalactose transaminase